MLQNENIFFVFEIKISRGKKINKRDYKVLKKGK